MQGWPQREALLQQFGAAIDMLANAIQACPVELWDDGSRQPRFWYLAYHTLFFLDFYLSDSSEGFSPPPPFTLSELDPAGVMPERVYTKEELLSYAGYGRSKCVRVIQALRPQTLSERCGFERPALSVGELMLYNLRHVQHGAAQLNLLLRQGHVAATPWIIRASG
jgi:hypothetical protein